MPIGKTPAAKAEKTVRSRRVAEVRTATDSEKERQIVIGEIRNAVRSGIASGHSRTADEVFDRLEAKCRSMSDRRSF